MWSEQLVDEQKLLAFDYCSRHIQALVVAYPIANYGYALIYCLRGNNTVNHITAMNREEDFYRKSILIIANS